MHFIMRSKIVGPLLTQQVEGVLGRFPPYRRSDGVLQSDDGKPLKPVGSPSRTHFELQPSRLALADGELSESEGDLFAGLRLCLFGPLDVDAEIIIATLQDRNTCAAQLLNPVRQI